jgi:hypothetical protein
MPGILRRAAAAAGTVFLLSCASAEAKPAYRKDLADYFGPLLAANLAACETCHVSGQPGELMLNVSLGKPHNAFGARLMAAGKAAEKAGRRSDIAARLDAVAKEDSDRDGAANIVELLTGHRPGAPRDLPTAAERSRSPRLLLALAKRRSAYAWRPFEAVQPPAVPRVKNAGWVRNPIDAFVAAEHEARGLRPRPEAARNVLLRRVYLDLSGLPPSRSELQAFLSDRSPDAYERVVDRLLASPQYGERWGRHWMDVWRYSDWDGYGDEVRNSQPHIWRWRDWIVESLNADKGYDRMLQEMLAGDELAPEDPKVLPATGFLVRNWYKFSRHESLNKLVEGTSKAFLGMTINCARCHDHKFDPVSMKEYYNFRAFFEPHDIRIDRLPGQPDVNKQGIARVYDSNLAAETFLFLQGDDRKPDRSQPASPGIPAVFGGGPLKSEAVSLPLTAFVPDKRDFVVRETVAAGEQAIAQAKAALEAATGKADPGAIRCAEMKLAAAEAQQAALLATLRVEQLEDTGQMETGAWTSAALEATAAQRRAAVAEATSNQIAAQAQAAALERGLENAKAVGGANDAGAKAIEKAVAELTQARKKLEQAEQQVAAANKSAQLPPGTAYTKRDLKAYPSTSTGRRLALARWITDARNPLTARVAVNHIWLRHFGKGLVPTVFDFGRNGQPPSHPALLDYLAGRFAGVPGPESRLPSRSRPRAAPDSGLGTRDPGWSMKRLHRLIVTSSAYRMDSGYDPASAAKDPDNRYLWRMNSRRMEAEVVRDSILHTAGQLDRTMGGPELDQNLGLTSRRRSLYLRHSMEKQVEFLATFDQANVNECYERTESVVPQQALALANSALSVGQARILARDLWEAVEGRPTPVAGRDFVSAAFLQILGRTPSRQERGQCEQFLQAQASLLSEAKKLTPFATGAANPVTPSADPQQRARESLVHVLLNHNDFVTIR